MKPRNVGEQLLQPCLLDRLQDETPALDNATARLRKLQEDRERVAKEGKAPTADLEERLFVALTDVRELQKQLKAQGVKLTTEADETTTGPASFTTVDPDGNPILVDQHV